MKTDREKLIELLEKAKETYYMQTPIGELISGEMTVEFVADYLIERGVTIPVRCKDCKDFTPCEEIDGVSWTGYCNYGEIHTDEDDFCSRGEREEE